MPQYLMRRSATSTGAIKPCAATGLPMRRLALSAAIATALAPHAATAQSAPAISRPPRPGPWRHRRRTCRAFGRQATTAGGVLGGERIDLVDKTIQTRSNSEYGIHATAASAAFATNVNVQTSGSYAAGVLAKGTAATAALMGDPIPRLAWPPTASRQWRAGSLRWMSIRAREWEPPSRPLARRPAACWPSAAAPSAPTA